jgi:hypothetical protein
MPFSLANERRFEALAHDDAQDVEISPHCAKQSPAKSKTKCEYNRLCLTQITQFSR